jgi:magnesium transporter
MPEQVEQLLQELRRALAGNDLPALRRFGVDPAIASGPLVTTLNDSASWAIYLVLATLLLRMGI